MPKGFTLIELLVVSGIVIFLSAIVFINYRLIGEGLLLQRSSYKLAQDIRRAGEMAMSAKEFQGTIPRGGYGINLRLSENTSYTLYADINGDERYDGADGVVETIFFEKGVLLQGISRNDLSINFKPPAPTIRLDGLSSAAIILALQSGDLLKTAIIRVNGVGLIDIE